MLVNLWPSAASIVLVDDTVCVFGHFRSWRRKRRKNNCFTATRYAHCTQEKRQIYTQRDGHLSISIDNDTRGWKHHGFEMQNVFKSIHCIVVAVIDDTVSRSSSFHTVNNNTYTKATFSIYFALTPINTIHWDRLVIVVSSHETVPSALYMYTWYTYENGCYLYLPLFFLYLISCYLYACSFIQWAIFVWLVALFLYTFLLFSSPFSYVYYCSCFHSLSLSLFLFYHILFCYERPCAHNRTCVMCVYVFGFLNICFMCFFFFFLFCLSPLAIVAHIKCVRFFYVEFVKPFRVKTATKAQINHQYRYTSIPRWMYKFLNSLKMFFLSCQHIKKDIIILFITNIWNEFDWIN